jgi:hypothetical protein
MRSTARRLRDTQGYQILAAALSRPNRGSSKGTMMASAASVAMARVASEASLATAMVYDRNCTNASTSTDKVKMKASNHMPSMLLSVVAWTVKSLAALQSGVTTSAQK